MKNKKVLKAFAVALFMMTALSACSDEEEPAAVSSSEAGSSAGSEAAAGSGISEDAQDLFNKADTLSFEYSSGANQDTDIMSGDEVVGHLSEEGIFDTTWSVSVDGETWFYAKFVTDEPINDVEGVISATTYGAYDANGNLLGYAQQQVITPEGKDQDYYLVYLDADGNQKDYYSDEKGYYLWDAEGNVLAGEDISLDLFDDAVVLEIADGKAASIDAWDKLFMYISFLQSMGD